MAFVHGKNTVIKLGAQDLSAYVNTSELNRTADSHDVTTYGGEEDAQGRKAHEYFGGLLDGKATMEGIYDNTATTGPKAVIEALLGTTVTLVRQTEGTGSGLPQDSVTVLVTSYVETNPVADMVTWSCEMQMSGVVDTTPQT